MAKYSQTWEKPDGTYETREYTDIAQTAVEKGAEAVVPVAGFLLGAIFHSKITLGITLIVIGLFVSGASVGWAILLLLTGSGLIAWWFINRAQIKKAIEEEAAAAADSAQRKRDREEEERRRAQQLALSERLAALRKAEALAAAQVSPPTEPVVALAPDETELARFWTKQGDKGLLTTRRLIIDHATGAVSMLKIADITSLTVSSHDEFDGTIKIPTGADPQNSIAFSSASEMRRIYGLLRGAMFGTTSPASEPVA